MFEILGHLPYPLSIYNTFGNAEYTNSRQSPWIEGEVRYIGQDMSYLHMPGIQLDACASGLFWAIAFIFQYAVQHTKMILMRVDGQRRP